MEGQMNTQLENVVDRLFAEFEAGNHSPVSRAAMQNVSNSGESADIDSDWHDVPLEIGEEEWQSQPQTADHGQIQSAWKNWIEAGHTGDNSFIPKDCTLHANLEFQAMRVEIQGIVTGNIGMPSGSLLVIDKHAMITGHIECCQISAAGVIAGNIQANQVELKNTASVQGDIFYEESIQIASGAEICGRIQKLNRTSTRND
jgi:cytoskeletal protein CcmA (bactofilin family)